jgi:hypothetical protein
MSRIPHVAVATALLVLAACDKKPSTDSASSTAATSSASTTGAAGKTDTTTAPAKGDTTTVLATCNDPSVGICREYFGLVPMLADDLCKGLEGKGVLKRGSTPCARDNMLGTCMIKGDDASEAHYYYRTQDGDSPDIAKASCDMKSGAWTAAPQLAASAKPQASGKGAAKAKK